MLCDQTSFVGLDKLGPLSSKAGRDAPIPIVESTHPLAVQAEPGEKHAKDFARPELAVLSLPFAAQCSSFSDRNTTKSQVWLHQPTTTRSIIVVDYRDAGVASIFTWNFITVISNPSPSPNPLLLGNRAARRHRADGRKVPTRQPFVAVAHLKLHRYINPHNVFIPASASPSGMGCSSPPTSSSAPARSSFSSPTSSCYPGPATAWLSPSYRPSDRQVCPKKDRMASVTTESLWREAKGRLC